ncbi:MAG: hypothetical protein LBF67_04150 [Prevotellaceae bacterium]|jgi:hypothetical protein|nr:hypothetical protein [Prevotellaceae bacterium]
MKTKMKKYVLSGSIIALTVMFCSFFAGASAENQAGASQAQGAPAAESSAPCKNLGEFLSREYLNLSKPDTGKAARIIGVQEKDAIRKALEVCAKLKAKRVKSDGEDLVYELPEKAGSIVVQEVYDGSLFVRLTLKTDCTLPFAELRYVSLKHYNSKR